MNTRGRYAARDTENRLVDCGGIYAPNGLGRVFLGSADDYHEFDVTQARRLAVGLLCAISDALGEGDDQ